MSAVHTQPTVAHYQKMSGDYLTSVPVPKSATLHSYEQDGIPVYFLRFGWNLLDGVVFHYLHGPRQVLELFQQEGGMALVLASVNEMALDDGIIYTYLHLDLDFDPALDDVGHLVECKIQALQQVPSKIKQADVYQLAHAPQSFIVFVADTE